MIADFIITLMLVVFGILFLSIAGLGFYLTPEHTWGIAFCIALGVSILVIALWLHIASRRMKKKRGFT